MKKFYSLFLLTVVAMLGLQAQAAVWLVGDAFNGWNESGNVEMTQDGDIYSYTAEVGANKYFAFFKDTQGWNYQRGPARGNDSAPLGDWEDTQAGGAWKITAAGTYTFEYNYSTDQARIVAGSIVEPDPFDADALTFVATGEAVGGWNMPPTVIFTKNNDGTHSLEIDATAAEFKIAGVKDYSSLGWGDFDAGVYGGATLALGDNTLTAGQTANMAMPQAGKLLLTVSDVTESSCNLNIAVVGEAEQAYYLIGSFNDWSDETKPAFTKMDDGSFQLQQALEAGATFKVKDQNGVWYGGDTQGQSEQFELKADFNVTALTPGDAAVNFIINTAGNYTFAIKDGYLTVTGWGEEPQPAELAGVKIIGSYTEDWAEKVELDLELTDEGYKLADQQIGANFQFKVVAIYSDQSEKWLSPASDGNFEVNEDQLGNELALAEENPNLYFPAAGMFSFNVSEDLSKLVINGEFFQEPAAELTGVYIIGSYDAEWTNKEELQLGLSEAGGYVLADQVIDNGFEFKVVARYSDQSEKWFAPASDGKFLVNAEQLGNELALAEENPNNMYFENPGTFTFTVAEDLSKLVITGQFDDVPEPGHNYVLKGSFDEWGEGIAFAEQEDGSFVAEQSLEAGAEFKVMDGETWLGGDTQGQSEQFELKADFNVVELSEAGVNFIINTAGDYTFTIKDGYLTVTGWEEQPEPEKAFYLLGDFNNWNQSEEDEVVAFVKNDNNTWEVTRTFKGEFKIKDQDGNWYGGAADEGTNYWLTKENPGTELVNPGANFYFENEGEYTLVLTPLEAGGYSIYASGFEDVPEPGHNYVLKGSFDEWGEGIAFAEQEDGSFVAEQSLEAGAEFKVMDGETWLGGDTQGQSEQFELKADFNVVELSEAGVNFIINTAGDYTFTIKDGYLTVTGWADVPEPEHNYVLKGSFDEWGEGIAFAEQEDGSFVAEQSLEAGAEFKVMDGETWLGGDTQGQSEQFELKADFNVVELSEAGVNFIINTAGDYTFTIKDGYLTVTGWADVPEPEHNYVLKGSFDEWGEGIAFAEQEDGSYVAEQSLEAGAEFKVMDGETWLGGDTQGQSEQFELKADFNVVELSEAGVNFIINTAGDYTFTIKDGYLTVTGWAEQPVAPIYVLGNCVGEWDPTVGQMIEGNVGTDDDGNSQLEYMGEIEVVDSGDGYGYFAFTRRLAADNEGFDEIAQYRFGPESNGDFEINSEMIGIDINMIDGYQTAFKAPAGMIISFDYIENGDSHVLRVYGDVPQREVYVLGHINGLNFVPFNGVQMTTDDGNLYEATVTVDDIQDGGWFSFTTKLAVEQDDSDAMWAEIAGNRFTAVSEGDFIVMPEQLGQPISLTEIGNCPNAIKIAAGDWKLTVDMGARTLVIEESAKDPMDVNNDGVVDVGDVNAILEAILNEDNSERFDVNHDGNVDVGDVNAVLGAILEQSPSM